MAEQKKQASDIDERGNVLYLDQERLDRKEVGFPPYKNKPNGLGIYNWLLEHVIYMSRSRWPLALKLYRMFVKFSVWMKEGGWKARVYKTGIKLYPDMERPTGTVVMPLNVDVTDQGEKVVIPLDLIKESLKRVTYIAGMDGCLCREANDCEEYPHALGCLFLGEAAKAVVEYNAELQAAPLCSKALQKPGAVHGLIAGTVDGAAQLRKVYGLNDGLFENVHMIRPFCRNIRGIRLAKLS